VHHHIDTGEARPIQLPRRLLLAEQAEVGNMLNDIRGVIEQSDGLVTSRRSSQEELGPPFLRGLQEPERRNEDCFSLYQTDDTLGAMAR
jgi:hypothetical protein